MQHMSLWKSFLIAATVAACDSPDDEALLEQLDEVEEVDELFEDGGGVEQEGRELTLSTQPAPESGAYAHNDGPHTVCASSLTVYNNGKVGTLTWGASFWIDSWGDGKNHAWGWGNNPGSNQYYWGWVYNGWFC